MVYPRHPLLALGVSFRPVLQEYWYPPEEHFPLSEESHNGDQKDTPRPLIFFAAPWLVSSIAPASHHTLISTVQYQERAHALD